MEQNASSPLPDDRSEEVIQENPEAGQHAGKSKAAATGVDTGRPSGMRASQEHEARARCARQNINMGKCLAKPRRNRNANYSPLGPEEPVCSFFWRMMVERQQRAARTGDSF